MAGSTYDFTDAQVCEGAHADCPLSAMLSLWEGVAVPRPAEDIEKERASLAPSRYARKRFELARPNLAELQERLSREADEEVHTFKFWEAWSLKDQYVRSHIKERYGEALASWERSRESFEKQEDAAEKAYNEAQMRECDARRARFDEILTGDDDYLTRSISELASESVVPLPFALSVQRASAGSLDARVLLPGIDELPLSVTEVGRGGRPKVKAKTQRALREEYACYLFALTAFLACRLFNLSPAFRQVVVSDYRLLDHDGDVGECVFSASFDREGFLSALDDDRSDPEALCLSFEHRCDMTKTKVIKPVESIA